MNRNNPVPDEPTNAPGREPWRVALHVFANELAGDFARRPEVLGVAIGGSLARGMEWPHSDVELGVVVSAPLSDVGHFGVRSQRGYEVFQLVESKLREQLDRAKTEPTVAADWPIQLFQCRIVHDPKNLLAPFKSAFDGHLFSPGVVRIKLERCLAAFDKTLVTTRQHLAEHRPFTALASLRAAMNHLILAFHWAHGELPRSQNRTESRLREICRRVNRPDFHALFLAVYGLEPFDEPELRESLRAGRMEMERIVRAWGEQAPAFFRDAVDGQLAWGESLGIVAVHRLCVPMCIRADTPGGWLLDSDDWRNANPALVRFLGVEAQRSGTVGWLLSRVLAMRERMKPS